MDVSLEASPRVVAYGAVALSNMYPEAKSVGLWLRHGWQRGGSLRDQFLDHAGGARMEPRSAAQESRTIAAGNTGRRYAIAGLASVAGSFSVTSNGPSQANSSGRPIASKRWKGRQWVFRGSPE
jgi:hypothetical protein